MKGWYQCIEGILTFPRTAVDFDPHTHRARVFAEWHKTNFTGDKW